MSVAVWGGGDEFINNRHEDTVTQEQPQSLMSTDTRTTTASHVYRHKDNHSQSCSQAPTVSHVYRYKDNQSVMFTDTRTTTVSHVYRHNDNHSHSCLQIQGQAQSLMSTDTRTSTVSHAHGCQITTSHSSSQITRKRTINTTIIHSCLQMQST